MCRWNLVMIIHAVWCLIWQIWSCTKRLYKLSSTWAWLHWQCLGFQWCLHRLFKTQFKTQLSEHYTSGFSQSADHLCRRHLRAQPVLWGCSDPRWAGSCRMATGFTWITAVPSQPTALCASSATRDTLWEGFPHSFGEGMDTAFYCKPTAWSKSEQKASLPSRVEGWKDEVAASLPPPSHHQVKQRLWPGEVKFKDKKFRAAKPLEPCDLCTPCTCLPSHSPGLRDVHIFWNWFLSWSRRGASVYLMCKYYWVIVTGAL